MTLIFDLDDTLYDRCAPFVKALEMALGKEITGNKREWYHIYSICSQEMFEAQARGEVSLADSRILRIRKAMKYFEVPFSEEQEQAYQDAYAKEQGNVWMSDTINELMDLGMQMGTTMAVLTNGPVDHQLKKQQLCIWKTGFPGRSCLSRKRSGIQNQMWEHFTAWSEC